MSVTGEVIDSRSLSDLEPEARRRAIDFLARCQADGLEVLITSTYRSAARQQQIYNQGRTTPGMIVSGSRPGFSMHNFRCALDVVPMRGKKAVWDNRKPENLALWMRIGKHGKDAGFEWGGDWKRFVDMPHLQYTSGMKLSELRAKYGMERPKDWE